MSTLPSGGSSWQHRFTILRTLVVAVFLWAGGFSARASLTPPDDGGDTNVVLSAWLFNDTNLWNVFDYPPVSYTNLALSPLGNHDAVLLDSTNAAWLQYNVVETGGVTNLTTVAGTVYFWVAPNLWASTNSGGTGPGTWGRLLEIGNYTTNNSSSWWSLYTDPEGTHLYFAGQTNGSAAAIYLTAPIAWTTNRWHCVTLTYTPTNSALYLDGDLATNGTGVTYRPGPDVLADGFFLGSDATGWAQAHAMFDDLYTYAYPLDAATISGYYSGSSFVFYGNPMNMGNMMVGAPSTPQSMPVFNAITGAGFLQYEGPASGCVTSSNIWITNVVCTMGTTNAAVTFTIMGGTNSLYYDVFGTSALGTTWVWLGQGHPCGIYTINNLPAAAAFLILGTPLDSDGDGLTDAYEKLVSQTDPYHADSVGDGMQDGWRVLFGLDSNTDSSANHDLRNNYEYNAVGWLDSLDGAKGESWGLDFEGNVTSAQSVQ